MRLAIACQNFQTGGGMERYVQDLVTGMHALGITPVIFSRTFDKHSAQYKYIEPHRINVSWLPSKLRDYFFAVSLEKRIVEEQIDLLISTSRVRCADIAICGGTHQGFLRSLNRTVHYLDQKQIRLETDFYDNAKIVVAHSYAMARELTELYNLTSNKICCLYPPINLERFNSLDSRTQKIQLRRQLGLPDDKLLFVFPCSGDPIRKGYPLLREFFSQTDLPIELVVAGRSEKTSINKIRPIGLRDDMDKIYSACDFTIMASDYEPFGLVGPESIACGTPVIVSDRVSCAEVLSDRVCIQFKHNDLASLRNIISQVVNKSVRAPTDPLSKEVIKSELSAHLNNPKEHARAILSL